MPPLGVPQFPTAEGIRNRPGTFRAHTTSWQTPERVAALNAITLAKAYAK